MLNRKIVQIEKIISNGYGLAHYNNKVVFIKHTIPGETIEYKTIQNKNDYDIAEIKNILIKSKHRIKPECPYFYNCGGCDFLHIDYIQHSNIKINILKDLIKKNTKIQFNNIQFIPSIRKHYRNKVKLHYNNGILGFKKKRSNIIVKIENCIILNNRINEIINFLSKTKLNNSIYKIEIRVSTENKIMLSVFAKQNIKQDTVKLLKSNAHHIVLIYNNAEYIKGKGLMIDVYNDFPFFYTYNNFVQTNPFITNRIIKYIDKIILKGGNFIDMYSGIGLFTYIFADYFDNIYSIESSSSSIVMSRMNLKQNKLKNIKIIKRKIDKTLKIPNIDFNVVISDPPRKGMDRIFLNNFLKNNNIKQFIYISCNPGTLTRDMRILIDNNFKISNITIFDMFPQTSHFETVVVFNKEE